MRPVIELVKNKKNPEYWQNKKFGPFFKKSTDNNKKCPDNFIILS